jgi:L-alanine-DL-glutamate epimerase-like enolase superfamily enzyme
LTNTTVIGPLIVRATIEQWPLKTPFRITGYTWETLDVLVVTLKMGDLMGRGEAAGVYYKNDNPSTAIQQIESLRTMIEAGISHNSVQRLLPPGGARNAIDSALWDLESKVTGHPVWQLAQLNAPRPLLTTFTCGADTPESMANVARGYRHARAIKLKLTGQPIDADRLLGVRSARPDVQLTVDANQGFTRSFLEQMMPALVQAKVTLIEQPFPIGQEKLLDGFDSPIPIGADESVQSLADMPGLVGRFNVVNIKLDKCGGLSEGLAMARTAREFGLKAMVGNMLGTSLAMAPAFLVGQLCDLTDLDGPVFLADDRSVSVRYADGLIACPEMLWGHPWVPA